ncbi:MAG: hypothetical protein Kow0098_07720 [Ignavibacteriaceae bacterium]
MFLFSIGNLYPQRISFVNIADSLGINHTNELNFFAGGLSFADFDGDGLDDLSLSDMQEEIQLLNHTDSGFIDIRSQTGISNPYRSQTLIWADYDNDGDKDLFIANRGNRSSLFQNQGNFTFIDVTISAGLSTEALQSEAAAWADYDNDGWLDLYVGNRSETQRNYLYHNNGDGTFTDVTVAAGVEDMIHLPLAISFFDFNNDGWQDIYCANDLMGGNTLFKNNGDGTFTDVSVQSGADLIMSAMGIAIGDYDNNGYLDLYISNMPDGNRLLKNNGDGTFDEVSEALGVAFHKLCWGVMFFDYDNDTDLDLHVCASDGPGARGDPQRENILYENLGNGTFKVALGTGLDIDTSYSYGSAVADINNDGYLELAILNAYGTKSQLWLNSGGNKNWIKLSLKGTQSNRDGIGSLIEIYRGQEKFIRSTHCGISYQSQNSFIETIGIDTSSIIDSLKIKWPSGIIDVYYNVNANQLILCTEGETINSFGEYSFIDVTDQMLIDHNYKTSFFAGGVSFVDINDDGLVDITFSSMKNDPIKVYKNLGNSFKDRTSQMGITDSNKSKTLLWADFDNDGDKDLFIANQDAISRLFRHDPWGSYVDITEIAGLPSQVYPTTSAVWSDFDNDGWLDLYLGNRSDTIGNRLYHNNGNGTFSDITATSKVADLLKMPLTISAPDINNDGWADIYCANDLMGGNTLFKNRGNGTFKNFTNRSNTGLEFAAMGLAIGDYNNDGWIDIYVTNGPDGNGMLRNIRNGVFEEIASPLGLTINKICWGANFIDYDNDGYEDLFVCVSDGPTGQGDPDRKNVLFRNNGDGSFTEINDIGLDNDTSFSYGSAIGDFDNNGYNDIVVLNANGTKSKLFKNTGGTNKWIKLKLQGTQSNRDGLGARIEVHLGQKVLYRQVLSAISFESQNSLIQTIGIGNATSIDSLLVRWPSGIVDVIYAVYPNQTIVIAEGSFDSSQLGKTTPGQPGEFILYQNYPNPFNPSTNISYNLPIDALVKIEVFSITGEKITDLVNNYQNSGYHSVNFNARNLASGVYIYRISAISDEGKIFNFSKKMQLIR